jgi:hypothetical protein
MTTTFDPGSVLGGAGELGSFGGGGGGHGIAVTFGLPEFIDSVQWLLDKITGDWKELLIPLGRRPIMREAYDEVVRDGVFIDTKAMVVNPDPPTTGALKRAGLAGSQLRMKMGKVVELFSNFFSKGGKKHLVRLLGWLNKVLKSLTSAIPGAEAIAELKDACEEEMQDAV